MAKINTVTEIAVQAFYGHFNVTGNLKFLTVLKWLEIMLFKIALDLMEIWNYQIIKKY